MADDRPQVPQPGQPVTRRKMLQRLGAVLGVPAMGGGWVRGFEPFWVDYHNVRMPIRNLPPSLAGFRIAHLTDLHVADDTSQKHLADVVSMLNRHRPDMVVVTGDLISREAAWIGAVADLLGRLKMPVVVTFGNHDYCRLEDSAESPRQASDVSLSDRLQKELSARNCRVLRNQALAIERPDGRLWLVGMEDMWAGRFWPHLAFAGVDTREPVIALSHNPDTARVLDEYGAQWILCGHTHGGQVRIPLVGALLLPVQNRQYDQGVFQLPHGRLYVSRGVGYLIPVRFCCRPEVPTYVLEADKG